jgi:hypothetical protein
MAVTAIWAGVAPDDVVAWVGHACLPRVVDTPWQRRWIRRAIR